MNSTVIYNGPHEGVTIEDQSGRAYSCKRGDPKEIPIALAARVAFQAPQDWTLDTPAETALAELKAAAQSRKSGRADTSKSS